LKLSSLARVGVPVLLVLSIVVPLAAAVERETVRGSACVVGFFVVVAMKVLAARAREAGFDMPLAKPVRVDELTQAMLALSGRAAS
jgi:hypothetical protein